MIDLLYSNPWRPPDAWWRRAVGVVFDAHPWASVNRDSCRGCGWIKRAERFLVAKERTRTHHEQMELVCEHPAIFWAHWLHERTGPNDPLIRWAVEARILARQSDDEIAGRAGCQPEYVEAFESLFFNVRDRLDNRDFIFDTVIKPPGAHCSPRRHCDWVWKALAYVGGPHVLDAVMSGFLDVTPVKRTEGVASFFHDLALGLVKQKAAIATLSISPEGATFSELLKAHLKCSEVERATGAAHAAQDQIQENLQALLESFPFKAAGVADVTQLPPHDRVAAELRSDELQQVSFGQAVPGFDAIQSLRFPDVV
jgi:hypothetical protein